MRRTWINFSDLCIMKWSNTKISLERYLNTNLLFFPSKLRLSDKITDAGTFCVQSDDR